MIVLNHGYTLASNLDKNSPIAKTESKQQKETSEEDENKEAFVTTNSLQFRIVSSGINFSVFSFKDQQILLDQDIYPPEMYLV